MSAARIRSILRGTATVLIVAAIYEATARSGVFPRALMPTLSKVASTFVDMMADGSMEWHALYDALPDAGGLCARHPGRPAARHSDGPLTGRWKISSCRSRAP